jgi:peptidoglycan/LPS O-acetylase OafA/YrhL
VAEVDSREVAAAEEAPLGLGPLKGFRRDVQALRGVAVLAVVLYHAQILLPGGFVGVDVFFVISGFVIGRLLLAELGTTGTLSFRRFYTRRARRLLPALGVTLAVVVLLSPLLAPIGTTTTTALTGVAAALFSANLYLYRATDTGYFDPLAEGNPLLHTWSLSVEEQFYFLVPALVLLAWYVGRRWWNPMISARVLVVAMVVVSFVACVALTYAETIGPLDGARFAFFSPLTRAWEFAFGLGLVLLPAGWHLKGRTVASVVVFAGGVGLLASMVLYSDDTAFPGAAALLPVVGTAAIIYGGTSRSAEHPSSSPALGPLVWMGDISYSWYLWHWPVIVFAGAFWPEAGVFPLVVAAAISLVPAVASNRALEQRLRSRASTPTRTLVFALCWIALPLAAAALYRPVTDLLDRRGDVAAFEAAVARHADVGAGCESAIPYGDRAEGCTWGADVGGPSVVLIGDSNAGQFTETLVGANADGTVEVATMASCPFSDVVADIPAIPGSFSPDCRRFVTESLEHLEAEPPDVVVIANATDLIVTGGGMVLADPANGLAVTERGKPQVFEDGLARVAERLRVAGSRVVIVNVVPKPYGSDPRRCSRLTVMVDPGRCVTAPFLLAERSAHTDAVALEKRAAGRAGVETWDFGDLICPGGICVGLSDGLPVWHDDDHISVATATALAPRVAELLRSPPEV